MKINIHELKKKSEVTFSGLQNIQLKGINPLHETLNCEANVTGTITKLGTRYIIKADVITNVMLLCDRCLEEFECPIEASIHERFSNSPDEQDEEVIPFSGYEIDLKDIITEAVVLNVPMKWLHDDKCKGICKVCGTNLNKHSCHCDTQEIDPRLEALKDIFHSQSEE